MQDVIVELHSAGVLLGDIAESNLGESDKDYLAEILGERLLKLSERCEEIELSTGKKKSPLGDRGDYFLLGDGIINAMQTEGCARGSNQH